MGRMVTDSRAEYERRFHKVLTYIDVHLAEPLDLKRLAEAAHFSPYHFHRLFAAWMGETLGDYVRRRRVEVAASRLIAQPRTKILDVALAVGFGSAEAFSRAFRRHTGASPSAWRQQQRALRGAELSNPGQANSNPGQVDRNPGQATPPGFPQHGAHDNHPGNLTMQVTIVEREPVTVAYLRYTGPYGEPIGSFWDERFVPWAVENGVIEHPRYGISHDDPSITAPEKCRYDAAVEVPADFTPTGDALMTTIPGGRYASAHFYGDAGVIGDTWVAVLRDWLPTSGMQLDGRPAFEFYPADARYDESTGEFECQICVPVAPL